ncbi:MAG: HAD family hydrolase [Pseudomonadota bacterium]|nr:HAD family hydrolase [Pseudomonadota bacterium]
MPDFAVQAITLDLDDTLWPFAPIGERIEQVLHRWFLQHAPRAAGKFPPSAMRELREQLIARFPEKSHDASWLRRQCIAMALTQSGYDSELAEPAYQAFFAERNRVDFYPDAHAALMRIARRVPVCALTNGNADLAAIGIAGHFHSQVSARMFGKAKPDPAIFLHACQTLGSAPANTLHVGDDIETDIAGAHQAGLKACWLHREDAYPRHPAWPRSDFTPDLVFSTLTHLADWLEAQNPSREPQ